MIFTTKSTKAKGKVYKAVADFSANKNVQGKIVAESFSNLIVGDGIVAQDGFTLYHQNVLQKFSDVDGVQYYLTDRGVENDKGEVVADYFEGCDSLCYAFCHQTQTLVLSNAQSGVIFAIDKVNQQKIANVGCDAVAFCKGRLFGLKGNKLYYSEPTNYSSIFEENYFSLPKECFALVACDHLLAIGSDVFQVDVDGDDSHSKISVVSQNIPPVTPKSVTSYYNKVIFVAENVVYTMQNGGVKPIFEVNGQTLCATCFAGLYYLAYTKQNKSYLVALNTHSGKVVASYQTPCQSLLASNCLYLTHDGNCYKLTQKAQSNCWKSQPINFDGDVNTTVYLHRLLIQTAYPVEVHIHADGHRIYHVSGKAEKQSLLVGGYGDNVVVEVKSSGKLKVKSLELVARARGN